MARGSQVHRQFVTDETRVVVATIAFGPHRCVHARECVYLCMNVSVFVCDYSCICTLAGMGIDKPDVRCVIHYGFPQSVEAYHQASDWS